MEMTEAKRQQFMTAAKPLMEWLRQNCHPHMTVIVDAEIAELVEGQATAHRTEWTKSAESSPSTDRGEC